MTDASKPPSDLALVLSGGGARAVYQVGALRAVAEIAPELTFSIITGVSAGAINTAYLAAHPGPLPEAVNGLADQWSRLRSENVYRVQPSRLLRDLIRLALDAVTGRSAGRPAMQGVLDMTPLRGFLATSVVMEGIGENIAAGRLRAAALSATSYTNGCTVSFVEGASDVPMWTRAQRYALRSKLTLDHVLASAAIPMIFPAVRLADGYYGDGSVRQSAPLAPAIHLGAKRLLAVGMRAEPPSAHTTGKVEEPSVAEVLGLLLHSVFLDALDADAERLERINRTLALFPKGATPRPEVKPVSLYMLRPSRNLGAMARDYPSQLPRMLSPIIRAIGGRRERAADFLSYLMFSPPYTMDVMQLGYEDTLQHRDALRAFLYDSAEAM